jgi:phosphoribosylformimino-5-aminoimidazole carboxamide ribotide isomerase
MTIIPAIDLIDGACVRLRQGSYQETTIYERDPVAMAQRLVDAGATRIHLVDLDAARGGGDNRDVVAAIRRAVPVTLELGGGIRQRDALDAALQLGIDYAVIGTILARDPDEVARWAAGAGDGAGESAGSRMIASIDARDGYVRVHGWQETTTIAAGDLAGRAGEMGLAAVEYTNIALDGTLSGPDVAGTVVIADATTIPVILSGGIARTDDVVSVRRLSAGKIAGIIVGRALYEGHFDLAAAISATEDRAD